jgi:uncharacterized repeat protein (TIGR03803 family)
MTMRPVLATGGALLTTLLIFASYTSAQTTPWELTTLYSFTPARGGAPGPGVTIGSGGALYGTTGATGNGTVFALYPPSSPEGAWTEHVLHVFGSNLDGSNPQAGVTIGAGGVLYGTTLYGGEYFCGQDLGCGAAFSVTPPASPGGAWTEAVIHSFGYGTDGYHPGSNLAIGSGGVLYGTTSKGGTGFDPLCGTVFSLTPPATPGGAWTEAVLYTFPGTSSEGCDPQNLVIGKSGELYGTSYSGGASNAGTVFSLTPPHSAGGVWTEKVLYSFGYNSGGFADSIPSPSLAIGTDGVLYGTTGFLGTTTATCGGGCGTVFSLTPPASPGSAWTYALVYSFGGAPNDGSGPVGVVIGTGPSGRHVLYGATAGGGTNACGQAGCGTVYSLTPPATPGGAWTETILYNFTSTTAIGYVNAGLAIGTDGALYGATGAYDIEGDGSVFALVR